MARIKQEQANAGPRSHDYALRGRSEALSIASTEEADTQQSDTPTTGQSAPSMPTPTHEAEDGLAALGQHSRELIQAIRKLETLGIDATLPSLPKIVVVGDQSAGKSSIIEAICDVSLPRSKGTCTRCPFQLTTTRAALGSDVSWKCDVSILKKYYYDPTHQAGPDTSQYDCWVEQAVPEVVPFLAVTSKEELGAALRRAQLAVLNPGSSAAYFMAFPLQDYEAYNSQTSFSPNIISLEITGQDLPELSLFDLPGAITACNGKNQDEDEEQIVCFIERLIKNYASEPKAIILFTCTATQDIETTTTIRFLKNCKALPRTFGVMTKADLLTPLDLPKLTRVLTRDPFKLGKGWFLTKLLSQEQLDAHVNHEAAQGIELDFFSSGIWAGPDLQDFSHRFGIVNLRNALSRQLTAIISAEVPSIAQRVHERLSDVKKEISTFPSPDASPTAVVSKEIREVQRVIVRELDPRNEEEGLRKDYRNIMIKIREVLKKMEPKVVLSTPGYEKLSISIDTESDQEISPKKMRRGNNGRAIDAKPQRTAFQATSPAQNSKQIVLDLGEVKVRYDRAAGADLPQVTSDAVTRKLILESIQGWSSLVEHLITRLKAIVQIMLDAAIAEALAVRRATMLSTVTRAAVQAMFDELMTVEEDRVRHLVKCERHRPISYAEDLMKVLEKKREEQLCKDRLQQRGQEFFETREARTNKTISIDEQQKCIVKDDWVKTNLGADPYDREVKALAKPLAYYDLASHQFHDSIAKEFEYGLWHALKQVVDGERLYEELHTGDADYCARLLAEDPERERQRAKLSDEQRKLEDAVEELDSLKGGHLD